MNKRKTIDDEIQWDDIGGRLMRNLAMGIYVPEDVVREYIQNARDGYNLMAEPAKDPEIKIRSTSKDLIIYDRGVGMDLETIRSVKKVAVSGKDSLDEMAGFRGIGVWAGLEYCERLVIETSSEGVDKKYILTIEFAEILKHSDDNMNIKELIDPRYEIEWEQCDESLHFTQVTLQNVHKEKNSILDQEELLRIARTNLPCRIDNSYVHYEKLNKILENIPGYRDYKITIQSNEGTIEAVRSFPSETEEPKEEVLKDVDGNEFGRLWYCASKNKSITTKNKYEQRGFRTRVSNIAVGGPNIYADEKGYRFGISRVQELKSANNLSWFCGEIHITNPNVKPNTSRNEFELSDEAKTTIELIRIFYKERISDAKAMSSYNPYKDNLKKAAEFIENIKNSKIILSANSEQSNDLEKLIEKCESAINKTKGKTKPSDKKLVDLLRTKGFKDKNRRTLAELKKQMPKKVKPKPKIQKPSQKDSDINTVKGLNQSTVEKHSDNVDSLLTEIILLIENVLGEEHEEIEFIATEIQKILKRL